MAPISYRGPLQADEERERSFSQTEQANTGVDQPGRTVAAILAEKGERVYTITPRITVLEAVGELNRLKVGVLLVAEDDGKPQGIISERDIVRNIESQGLALFGRAVSDVMTANVVTCSPEDSLESIMKVMNESRFRHLPVTRKGQLCGLVSMRDIMNHRLGELEYENLKIKQAIVG